MAKRFLLIITIVINTVCTSSAQESKKDRIMELLNLTHQDSFVIKRFENISRPPSKNYSEIFNDSATLNTLSSYVKDTSLLNNMKTLMKDTAYMSLIDSFNDIYSAKSKTNPEDIKIMAIKFMDKELVDIYDNTFSIDEINDLIKFYQTSVGQKSLNLMPAIQNEIIKKIENKYMTYMQQQKGR
jgi:hypothetical protein